MSFPVSILHICAVAKGMAVAAEDDSGEDEDTGLLSTDNAPSARWVIYMCLCSVCL